MHEQGKNSDQQTSRRRPRRRKGEDSWAKRSVC
jgi:hypothetical protein